MQLILFFWRGWGEIWSFKAIMWKVETKRLFWYPLVLSTSTVYQVCIPVHWCGVVELGIQQLNLYKSFHVSRITFKQGLYSPFWFLQIYTQIYAKKHFYNEEQVFCYKLDLIKQFILMYITVDTCVSVSSIIINFVPNFSSKWKINLLSFLLIVWSVSNIVKGFELALVRCNFFCPSANKVKP